MKKPNDMYFNSMKYKFNINNANIFVNYINYY